MKSLRSIIVGINKEKILALHPQLPWIEQECRHLWNVGYAQAETIYCFLGLGLWMICTTIAWFIWCLNLGQNYQVATTQVHQRPIQATLHVESQRLFGEPVVMRTQSTWHVQGLLYDDNASKREVLLKDAQGKVQGFHEGDELPGGGHVIKIKQDMVEIEQNGAHFQLKMQNYPVDFLSNEPLRTRPNGLNLKD